VLFCTVVLGTLRSGVPAPEPFRPWVAAGAVWLVLACALALAAAVAGDTQWHRALWYAALSGFVSSWIFGVGSRILPIFLGCRPRWQKLDAAVFALYQVGVAAWVAGAWPHVESPALTLLSSAGALLIIVAVLAYTACLGLFARIGPAFGCAVRSPQDGWQKYVFAAWSWLLASLALAQGATLVRAFTGAAESSLIFDFGRHALAFGFAAQMVLGVASRVVPNFTGKPLWSGRVRDVTFHLLNASMAVRALQVPIGLGYWPEAWNLIAWSGPLGVLAMLLFTVNILFTIRQQQPKQAPVVIPVRPLQSAAAGK
jgi:hypothetical protein